MTNSRAAAKTALVCTSCGHQTLQWVGRCPGCGEWDSFASPGASEASLLALSDVGGGQSRPRLPVGLTEVDRVLGGGLVQGSIVLLAGEPGVGKSTLMMQAAAGLESAERSVVMVCGEESLEQVSERARRLGGPKHMMVTSVTDIGPVCQALASADVAIIDSIQMLSDPEATGEPGSVSQVRACALALAKSARASGTAVVLVGHVTKEGVVAGPRALEHLVDAVVVLEGDRSHQLRLLRASKNRFGRTAEVGVFEMRSEGLVEIPDASALFLSDRADGIAGSAVGCAIEGRRPVAVEVQALTNPASGPPRRVASGVELSRAGLLVAVLARRTGLALAGSDVYVNLAGGFRSPDPGLDLALAVSLASAHLDKPVPADAAFVGEVGLGGEVRGVPHMSARIEELGRLGFKRVFSPSNGVQFPGLESVAVRDLKRAIALLR